MSVTGEREGGTSGHIALAARDTEGGRDFWCLAFLFTVSNIVLLNLSK